MQVIFANICSFAVLIRATALLQLPPHIIALEKPPKHKVSEVLSLYKMWKKYFRYYLFENYKPHKTRLFKLFMCYKCVTKKHFYLLLNTHKHFLFLCSNMASICFLHSSYSACISALRKAIYSTVEVKPCPLNLLIRHCNAPTSLL